MPALASKENDFNWKLILGRLQRGKAVLLLGPEVTMAGQQSKRSLKEAIQNHIQTDWKSVLSEEDLKKIEYYSEDGFFFLEDSYRLEVVDSILEFYEDLAVTDLYTKIAQIPFHLILSLSPDDVLEQAFEQLNLPYQSHFYDKKNFNASLDDEKLNFEPSTNQRLIYNIFGSTENEDSLILSYDDLFEFLQRIFNNYKLPKTVRDTIARANCFVFVGFNYNKWYLKLLLRLMNMHEKVRKVFGMDEPFRKEVETFFVNEFDMNFTRLNASLFIDQLFEKCKAADILIQPDDNITKDKLPAAWLARINEVISRKQLKEAFQLLDEYCGLPQAILTFVNSAKGLSGRFYKVEKDNQEGLLEYKEYTTVLNRVRKDLISLINEYQ